MKLSEKWLREWINTDISLDAIQQHLTMAGLEVDVRDSILEFELTPNRGDCLSVLGIARELAALIDVNLNYPFNFLPDIQTTLLDMSITIQAPQACPRYIGCVIEHFSPQKLRLQSPLSKIQEKLKYSDIKLIHPIVDVMNYVMLELGQPLHAFDKHKIGGDIIIRQAVPNEQIILLDHKKLDLQADTLVIADQNQVLALAGIMGGLDSAISENTQAIFMESAFFAPEAITGRARRYGLHTDASHRFERGVDPELPAKAILRAVQLLSVIYADLHIAGIAEKTYTEYLPQALKITLRSSNIERILGLSLSQQDIQAILSRLNMRIHDSHISPPSYRFDINSEIDLIEEIARIYGYDALPVKNQPAAIIAPTAAMPENSITLSDIKKLLIHQGYQEIITYSFISQQSQRQFDPDNTPLHLSNPLSAEYAVMRTTLWPGLIDTVLYNFNRQQAYLRFFETGLRFVQGKQEAVVSGAWADANIDFFDLKQSLMQLLSLTRETNTIEWEAATHPALHPGQTAKILQKGEPIGLCGALHPALQIDLGISLPVFLFEIRLDALLTSRLPYFQPFSKFPVIRRDLAFIVDKTIPAKSVQDNISKISGHYLIEINIFDVYTGKNLPAGKKSLAFGLIFQAPDRTLQEEEIQVLMTAMTETLKSTLGAVLRE